MYLRGTVKEIHISEQRNTVVLRFDTKAKGELEVEIDYRSDVEKFHIGQEISVTIDFKF
jgi:hypothetical protein